MLLYKTRRECKSDVTFFKHKTVSHRAQHIGTAGLPVRRRLRAHHGAVGAPSAVRPSLPRRHVPFRLYSPLTGGVRPPFRRGGRFATRTARGLSQRRWSTGAREPSPAGGVFLRALSTGRAVPRSDRRARNGSGDIHHSLQISCHSRSRLSGLCAGCDLRCICPSAFRWHAAAKTSSLIADVMI